MVEILTGVILVTLLLPEFAAYTFPAESTVIARVLLPDLPTPITAETPSGVVLVVSSIPKYPKFDVYIFPAESIVIAVGKPVTNISKFVEMPAGVILVMLSPVV